MSELKAGDRVLVMSTVRQGANQTTLTEKGNLRIAATRLGLACSREEMHAFADPATVIPTPEPLPAPDCEGPWLQVFSDEAIARHIIGRDKGFACWSPGGCSDIPQGGTWHGPIDPRLLGVEVEKGVAVGSSERVGDSFVGFHEIIPPKQWEEYRAAKATLETLHPDIGDREAMEQLFVDRFTGSGVDKILDTIYRDKPEPKTLAKIIKATPFGDQCDYLLAEAIDALKAQLGEVQKLAEDNCKSVVGVMEHLDAE